MKTRTMKRGQAAVELAITMIMLVPLIFFALFLQDFAYYKTEGQEPVVTANSEFITPDFMKGENFAWNVQHFNRLKYCDHTAGYDSYDRDYECDNAGGSGSSGSGGSFGVTGGSAGEMGHHHATGAHQCWIGGGQQVSCSVSKGVEVAMLPASQPFMTYFTSAAGPWNTGGIAVCSAQLKIFNWVIPRQLGAKGAWSMQDSKASEAGNLALGDKAQFGDGSGKDVTGTQREWKDSYDFKSIHSDGEGSDAMGSWLLAKQEYAVMTDPWALTHISAINPHEGSPITTFLPPGKIPGMDFYHPLLDRTGNYYNYYAKDAADKAMDWQKDMKDKDFLDEFSGWDVAGDEMHSVPVTWMPAKPRSRNNGYASGYEDSRQQSANRSQKYPSTWGKN